MTVFGAPRLPSRMVERSRLTARIESDLPLVVLRAPAGYGKTAALIAWAATTADDGIWIRVGPGAGTAAAFVESVASLLADAQLIADDDPLHTAAASVLASHPFDVLRRGLQRMQKALTIVIDEAENLDTATVDGLLDLLVDVPTVKVRVGTRRTDAFGDAATTHALEIDVIGLDDLALSRGEAAMIIGEAPDHEFVDHVLDHGSSAALARLTALHGQDLSVRGREPVESAVVSLLHRRSSEWGPVFSDFITRLSLSEIVDGDLAAVLTGRPDATDLLRRAETEGLGYWRLAAENTLSGDSVFVITPVFRRVLAAQAKHELSSPQRRLLQAHVARWHLSAGRAYPALEAAVHSGEDDLVSLVVRLHWGDLMRSAADVRALFREVSSLRLRHLPLPCMLLALLWNAHGAHRLRAIEYFTLAAYGARQQRAKASIEDRILLSALESAAQRVTGRPAAALASATAGADLLQSVGLEDHTLLGRNVAMVYNQFGMSFLYGSLFEEAAQHFLRAEAVGRENGLTAGIEAIANLSATLALTGDLDGARAAAGRARREVWPEGWLDGYSGSMLRVSDALIALQEGRPDRAIEHLAPLAAHRDTIEHAGILSYVETLAPLLQARTSDAEATLLRTASTHRAQRRLGGLGGDMVLQARTLVALARAEFAHAENFVARMPPSDDAELARARIRLAVGDVRSALYVLGQLDVADKPLRVQAEHAALTAAALAMPDSRNADDAISAGNAVGRLATITHAHGMLLPLILLPREAIDALLASDIEPPLVTALERARESSFIGGASRATEPLTARERAVARALISGKSAPEIARELSVSPNTVKTQLRAVYRKLGVRTKEEAIRALVARGVHRNE